MHVCVYMSVLTLNPPPHSLFSPPPICQHWKSSFDRENPLSLLRFLASTAAACALSVWRTYRFLTYCTVCVHTGLSPTPSRWVGCACSVCILYILCFVEVSETSVHRYLWVFPNRQFKQCRVNNYSHPLIALSWFQGLTKVELDKILHPWAAHKLTLFQLSGVFWGKVAGGLNLISQSQCQITVTAVNASMPVHALCSLKGTGDFHRIELTLSW